jgi:hypothetical protein
MSLSAPELGTVWAESLTLLPQDVQAPRSQNIQAPRSAELKKAATFVKEADAACKAGNSAMATEKAKAAMELLKK